MAGTPHRSERRLIDPTISLFVSLYVILLAFFIVMNVISNQTTARALAVLDSVGRAFERPFPFPAEHPGFLPSAPHPAIDTTFLADAGALVSALEGVRRSHPAEGGDVLFASFDVHRLFFERSARLSEQAAPFLRALAALLAGAAPGERREAIFYFGTDGDAGGLAYARADALARALEEAGAPAGSIGVGLAPDRRRRQVELRLASAPWARSRVSLAPAGTEKGP